MICVWPSWCHCHPISSCFIKIQNDLTFLVPAYPGCLGKEAIKWLSPYLCVCTNSDRGISQLLLQNILQWSSSNMSHSTVWDPTTELHYIVTTSVICSPKHGLQTLTAVARSTQQSTFLGTIKWVSSFRLISNNNKWWWWMWTVAAYKQTHRPCGLVCFEGRRTPGTESEFMKWTATKG